MNKARRTRNTWSKRIPAIAVLLVSVMLCVLAVVYRGVEVTQVSVDDGGIWVTNQDRKLLGHLNYDALILGDRHRIRIVRDHVDADDADSR